MVKWVIGLCGILRWFGDVTITKKDGFGKGVYKDMISLTRET